MQAKLARWGNSLAVRIPASAAKALNLSENDRLKLEVENGALVVRREAPASTPRPSLDQLLEGMSADHVPDEIDWGAPVGREVW